MFRRFLGKGDKEPNPAARSEIEEAKAFWAAFQASGLFMADWYMRANPDLVEAKASALEHFFEAGWREGRRPNPFFDPSWYLQRYPDVAAAGMNPLIHYWKYGETENRLPIAHFDTEWYRETYKAAIGAGSALGHYLRSRRSGRFSPNRHFDVQFYLSNNPDVVAARIDPFEHFIGNGFREGRNPSEAFDVEFYVRSFMRGDPRDPLSHFAEVGRAAGFPTRRDQATTSPAQEIKRFVARGADFEEFAPITGGTLTARAKVIAFYLPQFHSIPENDRWWGSGFTEWTNVARATPRFEGHYQPRIPRDLGFYDLSSPEVMARQAEMAKSAGIHGFCFYYYNFNGHRLLERPVDGFLNRADIDIPFCLMWANENWTRRWDGTESEVLMHQDYRHDDSISLIDDIARHFRDSRYIRIDGRPLLFVYRADVIPDIVQNLKSWRDLFESRHGEKPIIAMAQGFGNRDPRPYGFDGAIEFPPHKVAEGLQAINSSCRFFDREFSGQVCRYEDAIERSLGELAPEYPLIKTVFPSWDNDARRQGHGMVFQGSTPRAYERWLDGAIKRGKSAPFFGEPFVFINAWNEWAEGAYLEPDLHFGAAYLNATARAVLGTTTPGQRQRIVLVGHDAHRHGAQMLLLRISEVLAKQFGFATTTLLCGDGEMTPDYQRIGGTTICPTVAQLKNEIERIGDGDQKLAITNTVAAGTSVPLLKAAGFQVVALIHELPKLIQEKGLESAAKLIAGGADHVVFPAQTVRDSFVRLFGPLQGTAIVRPQGIYSSVVFDNEAAQSVRSEFHLERATKLVVNVGYADLRKGVDLFCRAAQLICRSRSDVHFLWIGNVDPVVRQWFDDRRAFPRVTFVGQRSDVGRLLSAADVFALTSREDPFPSVVLEALTIGLPIVAFDDGGGFVELLECEENARLVPYCDVEALAEAIEGQLNSIEQERRLTPERFAFDEYVSFLTQQLDSSLLKVSVIVPNFNYARHLRERLISIFDQSHAVFEVIVLDDASTDDSVSVIEEVAAGAGRAIKLVCNKSNTGNPFAQWSKGLSMARGDLVWIAEADDIADEQFLERLSRFFHDESMVLAFCDSMPISEDGASLGPDYKDYYGRVAPGALAEDMESPAATFAADYLSQRNLILNVSGVLWRRSALTEALARVQEQLPNYKLAGDWLLYLSACSAGGNVGYCAKTLNSHRRHAGGVTSKLSTDRHLDEIRRVHMYVRSQFRGKFDDLQQNYLAELEEQFRRRNENA
ncbi:MAG: glycosyltransferase [Alphaproteobacteria bacterium]|nr:glycosyltransferase [Alphaproteobacteria bacterium]